MVDLNKHGIGQLFGLLTTKEFALEGFEHASRCAFDRGIVSDNDLEFVDVICDLHLASEVECTVPGDQVGDLHHGVLDAQQAAVVEREDLLTDARTPKRVDAREPSLVLKEA